MLANTRFRNFTLIALSCVVFIYLLHRNSEGGASKVIENFHHYTHKLVDLGTIEKFQDYTHKWSEALPWKSPKTSQFDPPHDGGLHVSAQHKGTLHVGKPLAGSKPAALSLSATPTSSASLSDATPLLNDTVPSQAADLSGPTVLELPHLQQLCRETSWTQGLWLQCNSYCGPAETAWCGGLNNARNRFQSCLRLAIDAGAGLIIPQIYLHGLGTANVNAIGQESCSDDWFDLAHTDLVMRTNCPQLELRAACPDAANRSLALSPPPETDLDLLQTPHRHYSEPPFAKGEFRNNLVRPLLQDASRINEFSGELVNGTTIFEYGDTYISWSYSKSDELVTVRKDLYKAVRFGQNMQQIGEKVRNSPQLQHGSYIAVHLRGEIDWPVEWGSASQQMALYVDEMASIRTTDEGCNVSTVFVSSGENEVIQAFRDMLLPLNYTVHDKWTVLADFPDELAVVQQADFDSKGIVDSAVLAGAMYFMGVCAFPPVCSRFQLLLIIPSGRYGKAHSAGISPSRGPSMTMKIS